MEPCFDTLPTCGANCGQAYFVGAIIGDCFCPLCKKPVRMNEPVSGDYFFGQCKCGYYAEARIELAKNGRSGKWMIQGFAKGA